MFSFWEQNSFIKSPDIVIIGSGIVGLNAALAIKKSSPYTHVIVLERGMLPYGASTRNAGFACFGSISELLIDLEKQSPNAVFTLVEKRWKGLQQLRNLVGDKNLGYEALGGYELFTPADNALWENCMNALETFNKKLSPVTGSRENYRIADHKISGFGLNNTQHLIENTGEGQVDTGMMMKSLLALAKEKEIEILNGANVERIEEAKDHVLLHLTEHGTIKSRRVIVCTNGFAKKFFPSEDVNPARAQVMITSPVRNLKIRGSFHYDHGYYYFRNVGDRLLLGGGRNLDFEGEATESFELTPRIQARLETLMSTMILPGQDYTIDMRWSGIMGLGSEKSPIIKKTGDHIYCAVRLGGMGVAIGTLVGSEVAELALTSLE
jgi:gamma-glutamylputrescine oxidase